MLVTSNRSVAEWGGVFGDAVVATMYSAPTMARLRAAKTQYDPANLFSGNLNITPA